MVQHTASGAGAPTSPPPSIGAHYTDTSTGDQYLSKGVLSASDWVLQGGAGGKKVVDLPEGATSLTLAHASTFLAMSEGGEVAIPARSSVNFPIGTEIEIGQIGVDSVTLVAAEGVQVIQKKSTKLETDGPGTMLRLKLLAQDKWVVTGDLVPLTYLAGLTWGEAVTTSTQLYGPLQFVPELGLTLAAGSGSDSPSYPWSTDGETWVNGSPIATATGYSSARPGRLVWSPQLEALISAVPVNVSDELTTSFEDVSAVKLIKSTDGKNWTLSAALTEASDFLNDASNLAKRTAVDPSSGHGQILCNFSSATEDDPATTYSLVTTDGGATWSEMVNGIEDAFAPPAFIAWSEVANAFIGVDYAGFFWVSTVLGEWSVQGATGGTYQGGEQFAEDPAAGVMVLSLGSGTALYSADAGLSWTAIDVNPSTSGARIANLHLSPSGFLAGDDSKSFVYASADGMKWTAIQAPANVRLTGIQQRAGAKKFTAIADYFAGSSAVYEGTGIFSPIE